MNEEQEVMFGWLGMTIEERDNRWAEVASMTKSSTGRPVEDPWERLVPR